MNYAGECVLVCYLNHPKQHHKNKTTTTLLEFVLYTNTNRRRRCFIEKILNLKKKFIYGKVIVSKLCGTPNACNTSMFPIFKNWNS